MPEITAKSHPWKRRNVYSLRFDGVNVFSLKILSVRACGHSFDSGVFNMRDAQPYINTWVHSTIIRLFRPPAEVHTRADLYQNMVPRYGTRQGLFLGVTRKVGGITSVSCG